MKSNFLKLSLFVSLSLLLLSTSCKKDNDNPTPQSDTRDQIVGTYFGSYTYVIQLSQVAGMGNDMSVTDTATVTVTKDPNNSAGIILTQIKGKLAIKVGACSTISTGFSFTIPSQSIVSNGETSTVKGYNCYLSGTSNFNGGYESSTKTITYGYSGSTSMTIGPGQDITVPYYSVFSVLKK